MTVVINKGSRLKFALFNVIISSLKDRRLRADTQTLRDSIDSIEVIVRYYAGLVIGTPTHLSPLPHWDSKFGQEGRESAFSLQVLFPLATAALSVITALDDVFS